ncbi:MAG: hypothetical protein ACLPVO_18385 [Desulfomonilaceae bacterium]
MNVFEELESNTFVKGMLEKDESEPTAIEVVTQLDLIIPEDLPADPQNDEFRGPFKIIHGIDIKVEHREDIGQTTISSKTETAP